MILLLTVNVQDQATPSYTSVDKSGNLDVKVSSGAGHKLIASQKSEEEMLISFFLFQDIDIMVTYSDASGAVRVGSVKAKDLSSSWVWKTPTSHHDDRVKNSEVLPNREDLKC